MKRRDFLKLSSAVAAGAAWPWFPGMHVYAAEDGYTGPLWLTIEATGGWDPTSFCDPKGYTADTPVAKRINNYSVDKIGKILDAQSGQTVFQYAPAPELYQGRESEFFSNETFFNRHFSKFLILNGIDNQTISHSDGSRHTWTSQLGSGREYPNLGGLIAAMLAPNRTLSFLTNGGTIPGAGVVVPVKLTSGADASFYELAYPNRASQFTTTPTATPRTYLPDGVFETIKRNSHERQQRLLNDARLPRVVNALNQFGTARAAPNTLAAVVDYLANHPTTLDTAYFTLNGVRRNTALNLHTLGRLAIAAHQAGACVSAHIFVGGFDTHTQHDTNHYPVLMDLLMGIDAIMQEATQLGVADKIVWVVGSDFGRTNLYNKQNADATAGKDHWPITSMMLAGPGIRGGRVIGATDADFKRLHLDPTDITKTVPANNDDGSVRLRPAHIHHAIRRLAGIDANATVTKNFVLNVEPVELFS